MSEHVYNGALGVYEGGRMIYRMGRYPKAPASKLPFLLAVALDAGVVVCSVWIGREVR